MLKKFFILSPLFLVVATHYILSDVNNSDPKKSVKELTQVYEQKAQQSQNKVQQLAPPVALPKIAGPTPVAPLPQEKNVTKEDEEIEKMELPTPPQPPTQQQAPEKPKEIPIPTTYDEALKAPDEQLKKVAQKEKDAWFVQAVGKVGKADNNAIQKFIGAGANIKVRGIDNNTPIFLTTSFPVIEKLIFLGAPINDINNQLQTPLVKIILNEKIPAKEVEALVGLFLGQPNIDIELPDREKRTALMNAVKVALRQPQKINIVTKLLQHYQSQNPQKLAAYVNNRDKSGQTALQYVVDDMSKFMLKRQQDAKKNLADLKTVITTDINNPQGIFVYKNYLDLIQQLLDKGANVEDVLPKSAGLAGEKVSGGVKKIDALEELYKSYSKQKIAAKK